MIERNKLFDLLGISSSEEDVFDINSEYNVDFLKIKMFIKLIEGADEFKKNIKKLNDTGSLSMDDLSDNLIFAKSFFYVEGIDVDNLSRIPELDNLVKVKFIKSLQKSIKHFEKSEQYEVCAVLFNIEKTLKDLKQTENI